MLALTWPPLYHFSQPDIPPKCEYERHRQYGAILRMPQVRRPAWAIVYRLLESALRAR